MGITKNKTTPADKKNKVARPWSRMIILVDMNAFFASIEQFDFPGLRNQPVAVTNGEQGTCIITSSYEARAYGIRTGMRLPEAKRLCPNIIQRPSRPHRYAQVSKAIMQALDDITPDIEIFSVDEAFLDVTACQRLWGSAEDMGQRVKQVVYQASGLHCSVGISGDKTTAKYAAKFEKPNGLTIIPPWQAKQRLSQVPVTELCGIGKGIANFLAQYGVYHCGDMEKLPISILASRFGNIGRRIWHMCQGSDPQPLHTTIDEAQSMGHGKVMPPHTTSRQTILTYFSHMAEKLAARLRRHQLQAQLFFIGVRSYQHGWLADKTRLIHPSNDSQAIFQLCHHVLDSYWQGEAVAQVQVTALDPKPEAQQLDLFISPDKQRQHLNQTVDKINQRYGELTLSPARLLNRSTMPNVIAPAWKPDGHRQTI